MGVVKIEGKELTLPDNIIDLGIDAVRDALSEDFPDIENADVEIVRPRAAGQPVTATVVKRGTHKGQWESFPRAQREVLNALDRARPHVNPAIALAVEVLQHEAAGDTRFFDELVRTGRLERAEAAGEREGRAVQRALETCSTCQPIPADDIPVGF
jgi:hypothetical protein